MTLPPLERYLNWVYETAPSPSRDHSKENLPPPEELRKLPRKMRPRMRQRASSSSTSGITGSQPGTSQSPSPAMSTPVKHPQTFHRPQHPQPPRSAANHNSARPNLLDQAELGRLYKPARTSFSKESTTRSRRDNCSGSNLSFTCLQRSHRDYFSGSPSGHLNKISTLTGPYREAQTAVSERSGPAQTPPHATLPDIRLDVGAELPEAAATSCNPCAECPPVVLEIPGCLPDRLSLADTRTCPAKDPDLAGEVTRDRGPALLLLHAVPGSDLLQPAGGACSSTPSMNQKVLDEIPIPRLAAVHNKGDPDCFPRSFCFVTSQ